MQLLSHFRTNFENVFNPSVIAWVFFLSLFGLKHFFSVVKGFDQIDLVWISKILKLLCMGSLAVFFLKDIFQKKINFLNIQIILFSTFVFILLLKVGLYYFEPGMDLGIVKKHINIFTGSAAYFLLGFYLPKKTSLKVVYTLSFLFFLILANDLRHVNWGYYGMYVELIKDPSMAGIYQMWGDTFAVLALMLICSLRSKIKYLLIILSVFGLAIMLSRASLIAFVIAISGFLVLSPKREDKIAFGVFAALGLISLLLAETKLRALNFDILNSSSLSVRVDTFKYGFQDILANPITGEFLGQLNNPEYNRFGYYMHNYFSVWRQFGVLSFLVVAYFFISSLKNLVWKGNAGALVGVIIFFLVEVLFFRAYTFPYFWFIAGALASFYVFKENLNEQSHGIGKEI